MERFALDNPSKHRSSLNKGQLSPQPLERYPIFAKDIQKINGVRMFGRFLNAKKLGYFVFLFILLVANYGFSGPIQASNFSHFPTEIKSEQDFADYLLYLRKALPEVFQNSGSWFVDPKKVVTQEIKFLEKMNDPEVRAILASEEIKNRQIQTIAAGVKAEAQTQVVQLTDDYLKHLSAVFNGFQDQHKSIKEISLEISVLLKGLSGLNSQGLATGLVQSLPGPLKGQAFKLSMQEKIDYLKAHLTDEQLKTGFKSNQFLPAQINKQFLIEKLAELVRLENKLAELTMYLDWKVKNTSLTAAAKMNELNLDQSLKELESLIDPKDIKRTKEILTALVAAETKAHLSQQNVTSSVLTHKITIEELPSHLAVFRGSLNGDCFTTYAFGFAFSPAERTFIVRDENGKFLMTVYSIEVLVNGKRSLYIHEMGRAATNPSYGAYVFKAFYEAKSHLGYEQIIMGAKGMHHSSFRSTAAAIMENSTAVSIKFIDEKSRALIGKKLIEITNTTYSKDHDVPSNHTSGYVFVPKNTLQNVEVKVKDQSAYQYVKPQFSIAEMRIIILEELANNQIENAKKFYLSLKIEGKSTELLNIDLNNSAKKPVQEYYAVIKKALIDSGLGWDDKILKENSMLFMEGHLNSIDAWTSAQSAESKMTLEYLSNIAKNDPSDRRLSVFIKAHPEIAKTTAMEKVFRSLLKDNQISLRKAAQMSQYYFNSAASLSMIESIYSTFEFENFAFIEGYVFLILKTSPHRPTEQQLDLLAKLIEKRGAQSPFLVDLIHTRPELWSHKVLLELQILKSKGVGKTSLDQIDEIFEIVETIRIHKNKIGKGIRFCDQVHL